MLINEIIGIFKVDNSLFKKFSLIELFIIKINLISLSFNKLLTFLFTVLFTILFVINPLTHSLLKKTIFSLFLINFLLTKN